MRNNRNKLIPVLDKAGNKVGEIRRHEVAAFIRNGGEAIAKHGTTTRYVIAVREPASPYRNKLDTVISK